MQCYAATRAHRRCSNKAKYTIDICRASFPVCKIHQNNRLLSTWEKELYRRILTGDTECPPPPEDVQKWIERFHEGWQNTHNIFVSANFATALYKQNISEKINFNRKYSLYIDSKVSGPTVDTCGICLTDVVVSNTECNHKFCKGCINKWLRQSTTCPQCRRNL